MIGYVTIGVRDMERAKEFYANLFEPNGGKVVIDNGRIAFISVARGQPMVAVCEPYDKGDPTPGNGTMIAFTAETKEDVDKMHARALELGATDDGEPGQRIPDRFYGAYARDLDGNKICFFVFG
ncbi:Glyoxalase/bleomycin resistance protein/dioxygenase [Sulfitobacter noctilucicola]|uniref:Putative lactoylglutathione lyase n=1 Tax=Sulfitobacter noctilucicola TaxID=1342301 RepID=A0A7W6MBP6_9RHOB|nr:VOC family protein [Sulfitobacter noctilucicola]KIN70210.1 Glyoxalase/bleomycin resistance protein/dioxygenase [Sulfitobacter noctilucicola]MBB4176115.1 putative lactoylglutathione lyase [Sulfitobacter noctilucicola]